MIFHVIRALNGPTDLTRERRAEHGLVWGQQGTNSTGEREDRKEGKGKEDSDRWLSI
jgi:hypothetical protein